MKTVVGVVVVGAATWTVVDVTFAVVGGVVAVGVDVGAAVTCGAGMLGGELTLPGTMVCGGAAVPRGTVVPVDATMPIVVVVAGVVVDGSGSLSLVALLFGAGRGARGPGPDATAPPVSAALLVEPPDVAPDAGAVAPRDATIDRNADVLRPATRIRVAAAG